MRVLTYFQLENKKQLKLEHKSLKFAFKIKNSSKKKKQQTKATNVKVYTTKLIDGYLN